MSTSAQPPRDDSTGVPPADRSEPAPGPDQVGEGTGSHAVRRTDARPGLSEQRSAPILAEGTGAYQSDPYTTVTPAGDAHRAGPAPDAEPPRNRWGPDDRRTDGDPDTAVLLDGATQARPRSRGRSHVWAVLLTLLLVPVAWYLLADAGARLTQPGGNPWESGDLNVAAIAELAAGLLVLAVVLLAARWSSIGAILAGVLLLVLGVPFVAAPEWTQSVLRPLADRLEGMSALGGNVANHLEATGSTGRFVVYGLALVLLGVVSHGARRQGRREAGATPRHR